MQMITPTETVERLDGLNLTDEQFRKIHHLQGSKRKNETVCSHRNYLNNLKTGKYQNKSLRNYTVARRLKCLEKREAAGMDRDRAVEEVVREYCF